MAATDFYGMSSAFDGTPSFTVLQNTKWQALQDAIDKSLSTWNTNYGQNQKDLADFISAWNGQTKQDSAWTGEETNAIDQYYNGGVASNLAALTASGAAARKAAGNQALAYATGSRNAAQLTSGTGNSSYNTRLAIGEGNAVDIANANQTATENASNYKYLLGAQMGLLGKRTSLTDALAQRSLAPITARNNTLTGSLSGLSTLQSLNNANNFYGLSKNESIFDQLGKFSDSLVTTGMGIYSMGATGMAGGGGTTQPTGASDYFGPQSNPTLTTQSPQAAQLGFNGSVDF